VNYADALAAVCVAAKMSKQAADPLKIRSEFEDAAEREKILRDYAGRMGGLSKEREEREPQSFGSYVGTGVGKVLNPLPSSLLEAGVRGGGAAIGGALGANWGARRSGATPEVIESIVGQYSTKGDSPLKHLRTRLSSRLKDPAAVEAVIKNLGSLGPSESSKALHLGGETRHKWLNDFVNKMFGVSPEAAKMRSQLGKLAPVIREEMAALGKQLGSEKMPVMPKRWRVGGAIGGALAGAAVTGIPFAVKALFDKARGGEGAVVARKKMEEALAESEELQAKREALLKQLETEGAAA